MAIRVSYHLAIFAAFIFWWKSSSFKRPWLVSSGITENTERKTVYTWKAFYASRFMRETGKMASVSQLQKAEHIKKKDARNLKIIIGVVD